MEQLDLFLILAGIWNGTATMEDYLIASFFKKLNLHLSYSQIF